MHRSMLWSVLIYWTSSSPLQAQSKTSPAEVGLQAKRAAPCPEELGSADQSGRRSDQQTLTLCAALAQALAQNPELQAQAQLLAARQGRIEQAGALPNPSLLVDYDQHARESTVQVSQVIESRAKRASRVGLADADKQLASIEYVVKRAELRAAIKRRFTDVLWLQERQALNKRREGLAKAILEAADLRARAGRGKRAEVIRARLAVTESLIAGAHIADQLQTTARGLLTTMGAPRAAVPAFTGRFFDLSVDPAQVAIGAAAQSPESKRSKSLWLRGEAAVVAELAKASNDLTLNGGVRYAAADRAAGLVVGVALPLPVFSRNAGGVSEARGELEAAQTAHRGVLDRTADQFMAARQEAITAFREAMAIRNDLLPGAKQALDAATEAFQRGKLDYLYVLDAQRAYFDSEDSQLQALASYHKAMADIELYAGTDMETVSDANHFEPEGAVP